MGSPKILLKGDLKMGGRRGGGSIRGPENGEDPKKKGLQGGGGEGSQKGDPKGREEGKGEI